jgi:hypothetical protein
MRSRITLIGFWSVILILLSTNIVGQTADSLPEPQMEDSSSQVPPPPGLILPIDTNIGFLIAAGLMVGICFLQGRAKAV